MLKRIRGLVRLNEQGQGLVEYAMILVLVATVIIIILGVFGESVRDIYCDITNQLDPYFHLGVPAICEEGDDSSSLPAMHDVDGGFQSFPNV